MLSRLAATLGGALVAFHAWLLIDQASNGHLAEPGLVVRWLAAAGLVLALAALRRRGRSLFLDRRAVSVWLLAALLHGPALLRAAEGHESPALPETVVSLVRAAAAPLVIGVGLALLVLWRRHRHERPLVDWAFRTAPNARATDADGPHALAPRPPPAALSVGV